jgi:hypothetical protein
VRRQVEPAVGDSVVVEPVLSGGEDRDCLPRDVTAAA